METFMEISVRKAGKCFVYFKLYALMKHKKLLESEYKSPLQFIPECRINALLITIVVLEANIALWLFGSN